MIANAHAAELTSVVGGISDGSQWVQAQPAGRNKETTIFHMQTQKPPSQRRRFLEYLAAAGESRLSLPGETR